MNVRLWVYTIGFPSTSRNVIDQPLRVPTSPPARSSTRSDQAPDTDSPLKVDRALPVWGLKEPVNGAEPVSIAVAAKSSKIVPV